MLENRPIVAITIGYIIGIIMGLYFKNSIVLLIFILLICLILKRQYNQKMYKFKLISFRRYFRYLKIIITKRVFIIILISSIISNIEVLYKNKEYDSFMSMEDGKQIQLEAKVISNEKNKQFKKIYIIKAKNKKFYLSVDKNVNINYGSIILVKGTYEKPKQRTNYRGFDYKEYLKSQGINGNIKCAQVEIIKENKEVFNQLFLNLKEILKKDFNKDEASILLGIILGFTDEINDSVKDEFKQSNISHILAVSGMHIGFLLLFCNFILDKLIGKKWAKVFGILILLFYIKLIGYSPSAFRATIMAIIMLIAKLINRKSDIWTSISFSLLVILIFNPFAIKSTGVELSYMATCGILLFTKNFNIKNNLFNAVGVTLSVAIFIAPIMAVYFNKIPIFSLFISIIVGLLAGPIFLLGIIYILSRVFFIKTCLRFLVKILLFLAKIGSKILFNQIYIIMPNVIEILLYYSLIFISLFFISIYIPKRKYNKVFNKRIKNLVSLVKFKFNRNKKKVISVFIIVTLFICILFFVPKDLKIYFIDVGQGDSCLVVTPKQKTILIDGGGSENYDVGKNVLIPYLLARRIKHIDYMIISHFDTDHIGGLLTVMEELKVDKVFISKQGEKSNNYEKFEKIVNEKHIRVYIVKNGDRINIEKDLYFDILWPDNADLITENILNNNSIVCKFNYKNLSCLFTGDIEEIAEKRITEKYKDILNANILKVGHHGSKTSSIQDFLDMVKPKIALIGVGANNTFGHPNDKVIERLKNEGCKIYRTDKQGEIIIRVNRKGKIKIKSMYRNNNDM